MKRDGWKVKKLGEVCDILNGRNQKKVEDINGKYPIYGSGGIMGYANDYICKAGTTIIGRKGSINKPLYVEKDFWNVDTAFGLQPKECCHSRFLYYLCKSIDFARYDKGVTIPSLVKSDLLQIPVSIPSLEEQNRIVEELDLLSNIIEKKRQQLSELDNLAQSIFYDMFGDPNSNDKQWERVKFDSICKNLDCQRKPITAKDRLKGNIPYYGASGIVDYVKDYIFDGDFLLISEDGANLSVRHTPIAFRITGKTWVNNHAHIVQFDDIISMLFVEYYINLLDISDLITGCAQPKLTQANLNNILIFDVPLKFQQLFAQKIEAIEKQKGLIKQSIAETEELFNSRMDYYFS